MARAETSISGFLGQVRVLLLRHAVRRAVIYGVAAIAGLVVLVPLLGKLVGDNRSGGIALIATAALALFVIGAAIVLLGVVVPRRRYASDQTVARWVGERHKPIASDLLSAVELAGAKASVGAPSPALVDALITATSERLEDVEPVALLPADEIRHAKRWAIVALALDVAIIAIAPRLVLGGWKNLVSPPPPQFDGAQVSAVPLVGDLEASLEFPAYARRSPLRLTSTSGDVKGLPGTAVSLKAKLLVPAFAAELVVESDSGAYIRSQPALLAGDQLSTKLVIEQSARYRFAVTSPTGVRSIEAVPRAIEAEPDQPPTVQLLAPAEPLDVTNLRRVELAYTIEDDFGLTSVELVWEGAKDRGKKVITLERTSELFKTPARAQGKLLWDIAELQVPSGGEVRYWLEAKDNDSVGEANIGRSRELHLRVVSARERHEETLSRQQGVAEKILKNLAARLIFPDDNPQARDELNRQIREVIVELGSVAGSFEKDPHASDAMRKALASMRDRVEKLANLESKWTPKGKVALKGAYATFDPKMIGELEDDTIILADWLDRERMEGLLDVSDEIASHQKRLADLMAQYQRTKDARLLDEIEREMRALDKAFAELERHRQGMPEDVLDQYVNQSAMQAHQGGSCVDEVRKLVRGGQMAEAQKKLEACRAQHDRAASSLENSLAGLRGDKFEGEQKKLDEVMNELSDVAKDQDEIAAEASRLFDAYAQKADDVAKENRRDAGKKVGALVDKIRKKLKDVDGGGLTPFAKEELDIVERRLDDVEKMTTDGDLAEALGMAQQAKQSLETISGELEAAIEDDPKSKWADATGRALDGMRKTIPLAKDLITELQGLAPRPDQIMSPDDLRAMDRLRRREAMNRERAKRLGERSKQLGPELPGDTGAELAKKLGGAVQQMQSADERMKAKDPSGTREATRSAADALAKARDRAKQAARQAQEGAIGDEPVKIPGGENYKAPDRFREDLLEGAKGKKPQGYEEQIKRYYEDLVK